jgi:hypothetical protein
LWPDQAAELLSVKANSFDEVDATAPATPCQSVWEHIRRSTGRLLRLTACRRSAGLGLLSRVREVVGYAVDAGDMRANSAVTRMKPNGRS